MTNTPIILDIEKREQSKRRREIDEQGSRTFVEKQHTTEHEEKTERHLEGLEERVCLKLMRIPKVERLLRDRQIRARDEFDDFEEVMRLVVKFPSDSEPGIDRRLQLQNGGKNPNANQREAEPD